jgi:hypothetical protein
VTAACDEISVESAKEKAKMFYIRGKALGGADVHASESEELLSKAIRLDPSIVDAWNCLGELHWRKRSLARSRECFEQALKLVRPCCESIRHPCGLLYLRSKLVGKEQEQPAQTVHVVASVGHRFVEAVSPLPECLLIWMCQSPRNSGKTSWLV